MRPSDADLPGPARNLPDSKPETIPFKPPVPGDLPGPPWRGNGRPGLPPALASGPDGRALLKALGRRWLVALSLGLVCAGAAGATAWYLLTPKYTVYAQLRIASAPPIVAFRLADQAQGRADQIYMRTQAAMIRSRFVLNAALKKDEVKRLAVVNKQPDPIAWLEEELKVDFKDNSEIVNVSMTGEEPQELIVLVNAVTQAYLQEIVNEERKFRTERVTELDDVYTKARDRMRIKRETLRKRADELGTTDSQALTTKQVYLLQNFGELRRQHSQVQYELLKAQARLNAYKNQPKAPEVTPDVDAAVLEALEADQKSKDLVARVTRLGQSVAEYERTAVRPTEPNLLSAHRQFQAAKKELETIQVGLRKGIEERLKLRNRTEYDAGLVTLQSEINGLAEQEKALLGQLQALAKETDKIGNSSTELEMLRAEIKTDENVVERVGNELQALQVELRAANRVSPYQEAGLQRKDSKKQLMMAFTAPLAVFFGVCLCVAWLECRSRRIHTADEVVRGLGMRVVGAVPALPAPVQANLVAAADAADSHGQSLLESIDAIRTMLLRDASLERTRVIMVTSAVEGEGKTTLASHVAGSLARAGRRTLLVDCDLRCPAAHQFFEVPLQPGFSEAVLGEIPIDEAVHETAIDGLWVVPAGEWDREVVQALAKGGVEKTFERFKESFDFIVVDSHPVLQATDSLVVGQHVDAVILSLLRDVSQTPRVYAASQRLTNLGIRVLGAVVNGIGQDELYGNSFQAPAQVAV